MKVILVVEDEEAIRSSFAENLRFEGFEVVEAADGVEAAQCLEEGGLDLVVLDLMLPRRSGTDVLRDLRRSGSAIPVLVLTARDREVDKVLLLEIGADDYVTKPFSFAEVLARIKALLRRASYQGSDSLPKVINVGDAEIDFGAFTLKKGEEIYNLSPLEAGMLQLLAEKRGKAVTREEFLRKVWGYSVLPDTRTVDFHVLKLRRLLEVDPARPRHILTVHGVGYRLA